MPKSQIGWEHISTVPIFLEPCSAVPAVLHNIQCREPTLQHMTCSIKQTDLIKTLLYFSVQYSTVQFNTWIPPMNFQVQYSTAQYLVATPVLPLLLPALLVHVTCQPLVLVLVALVTVILVAVTRRQPEQHRTRNCLNIASEYLRPGTWFK